MTELTLEMLRAELLESLAPINAKMDALYGKVDALQAGNILIGQIVRELRADVRHANDRLRALGIDIQDINDRGRNAVSAGTVKVMNEEMSSIRDAMLEIRARLTALEQKSSWPR